jgi:hypothetical protein
MDCTSSGRLRARPIIAASRSRVGDPGNILGIKHGLQACYSTVHMATMVVLADSAPGLGWPNVVGAVGSSWGPLGALRGQNRHR